MPPLMRQFLFALGLIAGAAGAGSAGAQGGPPAIPVTVAKPIAKHITQWDEYSGRFEAVESVEGRARGSGFIEPVNFKDGQMGKEGDLLVTLDKRRLENRLETHTSQSAPPPRTWHAR